MSKQATFRSGMCGHIHARVNGWQSGMQLYLMPGLTTHSVQELNAGTVDKIDLTSSAFMKTKKEEECKTYVIFIVSTVLRFPD